MHFVFDAMYNNFAMHIPILGKTLYMEEKKKALQYMSVSKSRVSITIDMWTSENQKRGYMAITAHFIDDS